MSTQAATIAEPMTGPEVDRALSRAAHAYSWACYRWSTAIKATGRTVHNPWETLAPDADSAVHAARHVAIEAQETWGALLHRLDELEGREPRRFWWELDGRPDIGAIPANPAVSTCSTPRRGRPGTPSA